MEARIMNYLPGEQSRAKYWNNYIFYFPPVGPVLPLNQLPQRKPIRVLNSRLACDGHSHSLHTAPPAHSQHVSSGHRIPHNKLRSFQIKNSFGMVEAELGFSLFFRRGGCEFCVYYPLILCRYSSPGTFSLEIKFRIPFIIFLFN